MEAIQFDTDSMDDSRLAVTIQRLEALLEADDYDQDFAPPTGASFQAAMDLLAGAAMGTPGLLAAASPVAVGDGGILVQWGDQQR